MVAVPWTQRARDLDGDGLSGGIWADAESGVADCGANWEIVTGVDEQACIPDGACEG